MLTWAAITRHPSGKRAQVCVCRPIFPNAVGRWNKVEATARTTNVTILNPAAEPILPLRPRMSINLAVGLFVGLLLGLAAVFFLELLDRRVRSTTDLEMGLEAPLLGTLLPWHPSSILGGGEAKALPSPT